MAFGHFYIAHFLMLSIGFGSEVMLCIKKRNGRTHGQTDARTHKRPRSNMHTYYARYDTHCFHHFREIHFNARFDVNKARLNIKS